MIPFEFIIDGPPISAQTRNRQNLQIWKNKVNQAATLRWPSGEPPCDLDNLKITITYFYETTTPDTDNIIKPIQDALEGIVYTNDSQISHSQSKKKPIGRSFKIKGLSPVLAQGFVRAVEFLHIKIELDSSQEDLNT